MRVKLEDLSPAKRTAIQDFKTDITSVFNDIYGDNWDQERWDKAVGEPLFTLPSSLSMVNDHRVFFERVYPNRASASEFSRLTSVRFPPPPLDLTAKLISSCGCADACDPDVYADRYTRMHDTTLLMNAINSKQESPDEFWEDLRNEFMKGPPIFVR